MASGGDDGTVRLWETGTGHSLATLHGHAGGVRRVALSADGRLVASGGRTGRCGCGRPAPGSLWQSSQGHAGVVWGVALSATASCVASGGFDGTVRLWEASSGTCVPSVAAERRYERLAIAGLTGITNAQRMALLALGAVEAR